ncbi:hypothetical protein GSI_15092 [Ganoderma sinense ZZ0214-1]|uniref:Uncharacterized protein n=1 Tax=Ganoderma sinense ZZ0214-1 TaxID=1077348 RepID=A0A2G8RLK7_9APHY|nr:hypothetical protein GSI_15092 [Ganoderma sinense ZZ0214-1]
MTSVGVLIPACRSYVNAVLAVLNSRKSLAAKMSEEFEFGTFGMSELRFPTTRDSLDDSAPTQPRDSDIPVFLDVGDTETTDHDHEEPAEGSSSKAK